MAAVPAHEDQASWLAAALTAAEDRASGPAAALTAAEDPKVDEAAVAQTLEEARAREEQLRRELAESADRHAQAHAHAEQRRGASMPGGGGASSEVFAPRWVDEMGRPLSSVASGIVSMLPAASRCLSSSSSTLSMASQNNLFCSSMVLF